jgi:hypothetical protein
MSPLVQAIERAREANILGVAERLGARLKRAGGEWVGPCPRCGGRDRFAVNASKQIFNCRRCGVGGAVIALAEFASGLPFTKAVALVNGETTGFADPTNGRKAGSIPVASVKANRDGTAPALNRWAETSHSPGTLVEVYLALRNIFRPLPASLRFHPSLKHPSGSRWPAMVALVTDGATGKPVAIHRTYLAHDGRGKAPVEPQKMMLGPTRGGAVRLADPGETLAIGEGLESCLSAMQATGIPTWAALSTSGMHALDLPPAVRDVILLADGDDAGERAAQAAARRWKAEGRCVRIARPPRGMDFNDIARRAAGKEVA